MKTAAPFDSLSPVAHFEVKDLRLSGGRYDAVVKWIPAAGKFQEETIVCLFSHCVYLQIYPVNTAWMHSG